MTYLTPHANSAGQLLGRPHPARRHGSTPPAAGGTPATTSSSCRPSQLHGRRPARRRARLPRPDGRRERRRLHRRGQVRRRLAAADVGRPARRRSTTRSASASGNAKTVGDHDIWRLPQADDTFGGTRPAVPLHPQPAGVPGRRAGLADQPQPGRPRRRRASPSASRCSATSDPAFANRCLTRGRAHLRPGQHRAAGSC